jgi:tricorn protease
VSHQGVDGGDTENVPPVDVAFLGAELEPDANTGRYHFSRIYRGDKTNAEVRSPLDADYVAVREGDFLLKINGQSVRTDEDYLRLLVGLKGRITLTTSRTPSAISAIETTITPVNWRGMAALRYAEWIKRNEVIVEQQGGGRIGYVRLTDMQAVGLKEFMQGLIEHRMKDGLILDVRNNGGGSIEKEIIDLLERRPWIFIQDDRYVEPMWRPNDAFYGHVALLVNEYSWSDAELFPIGFKVRRLGRLIGMPGAGFNLGSPEHTLMDGGTVRRGSQGLWNLEGGHLEGSAAAPDVEVQNNPADVVRGKDAQLEAAVKCLLEEIEKNPPRRPEDLRLEKGKR